LKDLGGKKGGPIQIVSDRLEAFNEQKMAVFSGNVVATEGDRIIKSDQLFLYYKKDEAKTKRAVKANAETGDLDRIEAKGNVRITQGTRIITGEKAVYLNDDQKIIVTGNPAMKDGNNTIKGDKVIFLLQENRGVVESMGGGRVSAVFYPEDKDKKDQEDKKKKE
jgi:lipopolysaccharide export system protein LptA